MAKERLEQVIRAALASAQSSGEITIEGEPAIELEAPRNKDHGDLSCNVAMVLAKQAGMPSRKLAENLVARIETGNGLIDRVEIAGPGFINFYLKPGWLHDVVREIHSQGAGYGKSDRGVGLKVLLEFVSANPNGPITVGSGRSGVIGDTLARLYQLTGAEVWREYYINDAANSSQMINFGRSLVVRYQNLLGQEVPFPEDGYHGEYVTDIARRIIEESGDKYLKMDEEERLTLFTRMAEDAMITQQKADLKDFSIEFDCWYSERGLHDSGKVETIIDRLGQSGYTYEKDGAVWLKSTSFGDDKDRALVRSNGKPTYIASDAAYHADKFERGFNRLINVWGPDHHGYIARTKAAIAALGYNPEDLYVIIYQAVRLFSGGEIVMMSKRAGDVISLAELVEEVGKDAARYFLLMRSQDSQLDFDLELAKKQSEDNPVYYIQYAHARIASILRNAKEQGVAIPDASTTDLSGLTAEAEIDLMKKLADWPDEVATDAFTHQPHRLTAFAADLARLFHKFYTECRVLGDDPALTAARLVLVGAARTVLGNLLETIGVSAPEKM